MVLQGDSPTGSPVQAAQCFQAQADAAAAWLDRQKHVNMFAKGSCTSVESTKAPDADTSIPSSTSSALSQLQASTSALSNIAAAASLQLLHPVPMMHISNLDTPTTASSAATCSVAGAAAAVPLPAGTVESISNMSVFHSDAVTALSLSHSLCPSIPLPAQASRKASADTQHVPTPEVPAVQHAEQPGKQQLCVQPLVQPDSHSDSHGMTDRSQQIGNLFEQRQTLQPQTEEPHCEQLLMQQSQTEQPQMQQSQSEWSHTKQPQLQQSQTEESQTEQFQTKQPQRQQSQTEQSQGEHSHSEHPKLQQSQTEQPQTQQSQAEQSQGEQFQRQQPHPQQSQPQQLQTEQPEMWQPQGEQPQPQQPQTELAQGEQSQTEQVQIQQSQTEQPQTQHPQGKQDAHAVLLPPCSAEASSLSSTATQSASEQSATSLSAEDLPVSQHQTPAAQERNVLIQQHSSFGQLANVQEQTDMAIMLQQRADSLLKQTVNAEAEQPSVGQTPHLEQLQDSRELTGAVTLLAVQSSAEQLQQPQVQSTSVEAEADSLSEQTARVSTVQEQAENSDAQTQQPQAVDGVSSAKTDNVVEQTMRASKVQDSAESIGVQIQQPQLEQQNSSVFDQTQTVAQSLQPVPATAESSTAPALMLLGTSGIEMHSVLQSDHKMSQREDRRKFDQGADGGPFSPQSQQTRDTCSQSMEEQQTLATPTQSSQLQSLLSVHVFEEMNTQRASKGDLASTLQADCKEAEGCSSDAATQATACLIVPIQSELPDGAGQGQATAQVIEAILVSLLCLTCCCAVLQI